MRIVDPVIVRPLLAEWETAKAGIAAMIERADAAASYESPSLAPIFMHNFPFTETLLKQFQ